MIQDPREIRLTEAVSDKNAQQVIEQQIQENPLMIYMKGSPLLPQCGFSAQTIGIFNQLGASYKTFDVLSCEEIREGIKQYSNWPTIPQVYYNQEFIGGCDIVTQMAESGELEKMLATG